MTTQAVISGQCQIRHCSPCAAIWQCLTMDPGLNPLTVGSALSHSDSCRNHDKKHYRQPKSWWTTNGSHRAKCWANTDKVKTGHVYMCNTACQSCALTLGHNKTPPICKTRRVKMNPHSCRCRCKPMLVGDFNCTCVSDSWVVFAVAPKV